MKLNLHGMAGLLLSAAGFCSLFQSAQASPSTFSYTNRDLILVFRQTGFDGQGGSIGPDVFEVDIGQASLYYGATPGSSIPITAYSASQLNALFANLNDFSWSISGCVPNTGDSGSPSKPIGTLWVTDPRPSDSPSTSAVPWQREGVYTQGGAGAYIESILNGAATYASTATNSTYNTTTSLAIPAGNGNNANGYMSAQGNFNGNFEGDVEITTLPTFSTDGLPSICDFYELQPGSGTGSYLGYFSLTPSGTLTFYAQTTYAPPTLSVKATAGAVNISFTSVSNGVYTLFYTSPSGLNSPVSSWSSVSTNITGDGTVKTFQQPIGTSGAGTIYAVGVKP